MLGDLDRQKSSQLWLRLRAEHAAAAQITHWACDLPSLVRHTKGLTVIDTPGGLREFEMARTLMAADYVLMPVADALFDRQAAEDCWATLRAHPRVQSGRLKVAAVGMRVDGRTHAESKLRAWAERLELPFVGALRHTQTYVHCSEQGLTIFDLPENKSQTDRVQWQPVLDWLAPLWPVAAPVQAIEPVVAPVESSLNEPATTPIAVERSQTAPVVWRELANALQPANPARQPWTAKLARYFSSSPSRWPRAAVPNAQSGYQPSEFAAG
jgi:chromosome partitioning protein